MSAIVVPHEGVNWVVGGIWSGSGRFPAKPRKLGEVAREDGLALNKGLGFTHFAESQQGAWFVFDGGKVPRKARSLAAQVAGTVLQTQWPWRGLFRLTEDLYWLVIIDQTGSVGTSWDIAGSQSEIMDVMNARIAQIATIANVQNFNSVEESWAFLLSMGVQSPLIYPAIGAFSAKDMLRVVVPMALVGAAAVGGLTLWKHHVRQELVRQQLLAAKLKAAAASHLSAAQAARLQAQVAQVHMYWDTYPKPWASYVSWGDVVGNCQVGPMHAHGWMLHSVGCTLTQGGALSVQREWKRMPQATVLDAPMGALSSDWNSVLDLTQVGVLQADTTGGAALNFHAAQRLWIGMAEKYGHAIVIEPRSPQPFRPPYPPNTPPDVQKAAGVAPILWYEIPVSLSMSLRPSTVLGLLNTPDFVPNKMSVQFSRGLFETFIVKGTQYAQP